MSYSQSARMGCVVVRSTGRRVVVFPFARAPARRIFSCGGRRVVFRCWTRRFICICASRAAKKDVLPKSGVAGRSVGHAVAFDVLAAQLRLLSGGLVLPDFCARFSRIQRLDCISDTYSFSPI